MAQTREEIIAAAVRRASKGFAPGTVLYDECAIIPITATGPGDREMRTVVVTSPDEEQTYAVFGALPDPSSATGWRVVHLDMRKGAHPTVVSALAAVGIPR